MFCKTFFFDKNTKTRSRQQIRKLQQFPRVRVWSFSLKKKCLRIFFLCFLSKYFRQLLVACFAFSQLSNILFLFQGYFLSPLALGIKVRNLKIDFNTSGTWRRVKQWTLIMTIYNYKISLSRLVKVIKLWFSHKTCSKLKKSSIFAKISKLNMFCD